MASRSVDIQSLRVTTLPESLLPATALPVPATSAQCCGRTMSTISVTQTATATASSLTLLSCSSCSRHAWLQDGELLDRERMLAAVKARLAEAPRPRGGRPRGSGRKPAPVAAPVENDAVRRAREVRALLQGFTVHGATPKSS